MKHRRVEDRNWLMRTYKHYEPYIQLGGLLVAVMIGGATLIALSEKAVAYDGRITANEKAISDLKYGMDTLNFKQDTIMQYWGIPNSKRGEK